MSSHSKTSHTIYQHSFHIVWITKYRFKILTGETQKRVRTIIAQVAEEMDIKIINGVVSSDHIHLLVSIPPQLAVSRFVQKAKGRSSHKIQREFPHLKKQYWGRHFWGRGYFSATSGNITDEIINNYINQHADAHKIDHENNISLE